MGSVRVCGPAPGAGPSTTAVVAGGPSCQPDAVGSAGPERLRDGRVIAAVLHSRRQRAGRLLAVHVLATDGSRTRLGVVASRRVGGAVQRNRAKRLLREAGRTVAWRAGLDIVLVARAAAAGASFSAVRDEMASLAADLGLLAEVPA